MKKQILRTVLHFAGCAARCLVLLLFALPIFQESSARAQESRDDTPGFNAERDLISLHYDHAPDKDDGHSAAADRTILETRFDIEWISKHVIAVSGAYGTNKSTFDQESDAVMSAAWDKCGGWLSADRDWDATVEELAGKWGATIRDGGTVWIKEGGQSDITADVVRRIQNELGAARTKKRINVVQHSKWNEDKTTKLALAFVKHNTSYIKISDANRYLNVKGGNADFTRAAKEHPVYGKVWQAAFHYYNPKVRLDFSDTGELLHILGIGELSINEFRERFLAAE